MLPPSTLHQAERTLQTLRARNWTLATAESCTGGLIAAAMTYAAGASDVVECGFVTYSNAAKTRLLGVAAELIASHGAVSEQVAAAMAQGALVHSDAVISISVTGIAGPGGGSAEKPVGLVCFGCALRGGATRTSHVVFPGDRAAVRAATVAHALDLLASRAAEM